MRIRVNVRKGKDQDGHDCKADEQKGRWRLAGARLWYEHSDGKIWLPFGGDDDGEARPVMRLPRGQGDRRKLF
jgi:hypothetical protein